MTPFPGTSTVRIRLPVISRSRSRRRVSISGSSAMMRLASCFATDDLVVIVMRWGGEAFPGHLGGRLLRLLLRASRALAVRRAVDQHGGTEVLVVLRSAFGHLEDEARAEVGLREQFVEAALVVEIAGIDE